MNTEMYNIDAAPKEARTCGPRMDTSLACTIGSEATASNFNAHGRTSTLRKLLAMVTGFVLVTAMLVSLSSLVFAEEGPADLETPSDVENVRATASDSMIDLTWDVATDNVGVEGYKVYYGLESVNAQGGQYSNTLEVGDTIEYEIKNIENDVTYYFAVTAYDAAGNESESYSFEVEATPEAAFVEEVVTPLPLGDDGKAPMVKSAEGYSNVQIKVVFSEPVQLPEDEPQTAFLVEDNLTGEFLPLLGAEILNTNKKVVIIETAPQDPDSEYILTAGITVEDLYGKSVRSGTSDTATFIAGTGDYVTINSGLNGAMDDMFGDLTPEEMAALEAALGEAVENGDITGGTILDEEELGNLYNAAEENLPEGVTSVKVVSDAELEIMFSEPVQFVEAETHFMVTEKDAVADPMTGEVPMLVISLEELMEDSMSAKLIVEGMEPGHDYVLSIMNVVTASGAVIDSGDGIEFQAQTLELIDVIPPEEVTNFLASLGDKMVHLTWTISVSEDAIEQIIYQSTDGTDFSEKIVLPPLVSEYDISDLMAGMTYWFKITSRDAAGNESEGVVVEVKLPETGPGLALMFALSMLGTAFVSLRKKRSI